MRVPPTTRADQVSFFFLFSGGYEQRNLDKSSARVKNMNEFYGFMFFCKFHIRNPSEENPGIAARLSSRRESLLALVQQVPEVFPDPFGKHLSCSRTTEQRLHCTGLFYIDTEQTQKE